MTAAQRFVRIVDLIATAVAVAAGVMLALQALAVAADALMRFMGDPIRWVHEVTTYMLIGFSFLAAPYALRKGAHFRVTLLVERFSEQTQRRLQLGLYAVSAIFLLLFAYHSAQIAYTAFERGARAPTLLRTPQVIPRAMLPIGSFLLALTCIAEMLDPTEVEGSTDPEAPHAEGAGT